MKTAALTEQRVSERRAFFEAMQQLLRAYQFRDREETLRCGVSVTACYALEHIVRARPVTVKELAAALHLDKSTASRVAASMEADGYIGRTPHATDKRASWLAATSAGRALHDRIRHRLMEEQAPLLAELDAEALRKLTEVVRALSKDAKRSLTR